MAREDAEHLLIYGLAYHDGRASPKQGWEVSLAEEDISEELSPQPEALVHQEEGRGKNSHHLVMIYQRQG
jgi:hypothetical protein